MAWKRFVDITARFCLILLGLGGVQLGLLVRSLILAPETIAVILSVALTLCCAFALLVIFVGCICGVAATMRARKRRLHQN